MAQALSLSGQEGDLRGRDGGQGEGGGGVGPKDPVQQLLLLLLQLSPQLRLLLQRLVGEQQVLRELPVVQTEARVAPQGLRWLQRPTRSPRTSSRDGPPACPSVPTAPSGPLARKR